MTQFARPIQDITSAWSALNWTDASNLWGSLAEPIADDSRGIRTGNNPSGVEYECLLSRIGAPADASNLSLKVRLICTAGTADGVVRLRQGATEIAVTTHAITTTATTFSLSVPVASITDYSDLRCEVVATKTSGGSMSVRCFWIELSGADDDAPAFVDSLRALTPWALYRFREGGGAVANDDVANAHMAAADSQSGNYAARPTFGQTTMLADGSDTSCAFDGVNDEVESLGFTSYNGNGTCVLLMRGGVVANRAANETLFRCQTAGAAGLVAIQWSATGTVVIHWRDNSGSGFFEDTGYAPADNEEFLLAAVSNGTNLRVFIGPDGGTWTLEFTTTAQTAQGHDEIGVGANKTSDALAEFDIQTLAVFRSALTDQNLSDLFDSWQGGPGAESVDVAATLPTLEAATVLDATADLTVVASLGELTAAAQVDVSSAVAVAADLPTLIALAAINEVTAAETVAVTADLPALTAQAQVDASSQVDAVGILPVLEGAAAVDASAAAQVAATLPTLEATAQVDASSTTDVAATLPTLDAAAQVDASVEVSVPATLPELTAGASIAEPGAATNVTVDASLPALTAATSITAAAAVAAEATLPELSADATVDASIGVTVDADLPALEAAASIDQGAAVTVAATLPELTASVAVQVGEEIDITVEPLQPATGWATGAPATGWNAGQPTVEPLISQPAI